MQHRQILSAIRNRDIKEVEKHMKFHMNFVKKTLQENAVESKEKETLE